MPPDLQIIHSSYERRYSQRYRNCGFLPLKSKKEKQHRQPVPSLDKRDQSQQRKETREQYRPLVNVKHRFALNRVNQENCRCGDRDPSFKEPAKKKEQQHGVRDMQRHVDKVIAPRTHAADQMIQVKTEECELP